MKLSILATAAAVAFAGLAPGLAVPAAAQHTVVHERTVIHNRPVRPVVHTRKVCRVEVRHHHRVRTCRTVRTR